MNLLSIICSRLLLKGGQIWIRLLGCLIVSVLFIGCSSPISNSRHYDSVELASNKGAVFPKAKLTPISIKSQGASHISNSSIKMKLFLFWASWNDDSLAALDAIQEIKDYFVQDGLRVISISVDGVSNSQAVKTLIEDHGYNFEVFIDEGENWQAELFNKLGLTALPWVLFVDNNDVIVYESRPDSLSWGYIRTLLSP